jgi:hypothetical protein
MSEKVKRIGYVPKDTRWTATVIYKVDNKDYPRCVHDNPPDHITGKPEYVLSIDVTDEFHKAWNRRALPKADTADAGVNKMHGLLESLASHYKGFLPDIDRPGFPTEKFNVADIKTRQAFIEDTIKKADAIAKQATPPREQAVQGLADSLDAFETELEEREEIRGLAPHARDVLQAARRYASQPAQQAGGIDVEGLRREVHERFYATKAEVIDYLAAKGLLASTSRGWLPIETAPDDGTIVLLAWPNSLKRFVAISERMPDWNMEVREYCTHGSGGARSYHGQATHWMPLPLPPTAQRGNGDEG